MILLRNREHTFADGGEICDYGFTEDQNKKD